MTVGLTPGSKDENSETSRAWFDEDTLELPDWVRPADENGRAWITEGSSTNRTGPSRISPWRPMPRRIPRPIQRPRPLPTGSSSGRRSHAPATKNGNITGYSVLTTETVPATTEDSAPPANATINADGGWTSMTMSFPRSPGGLAARLRQREGNVINGEVVAEIRDENGSLVGYTVVTVKNGVAVG